MLENGTAAGYSYDIAGELLGLSHTRSAAVFQSFAYGLNAMGNRTSRTEVKTGADTVTDSYSYDATIRSPR